MSAPERAGPVLPGGSCGKVEKNWEMLYNRLAEFHIVPGKSDPDAPYSPAAC